MSLKDELKVLSGRKRKYLLMRITDMEADTARKLCNIPKSEYDGWFNPTKANKIFMALNKRVSEFTVEYRQEAVQMLRRDNQISAVLLEEEIISKMKEEIRTGEYNLIRTNLARDVYTKLIGDLDYQPQVATMSWDQRIQTIFGADRLSSPPVIESTAVPALESGTSIEEGETDATENSETDDSLQSECPEDAPSEETEQPSLQTTQTS